jgi:hypothetical protein
MRKSNSLREEVNNELTYFCFRKPDPESRLFKERGLLRLFLQVACYARYVPGPGQGTARVDTLPGWTAKQKSRALRKLERMGFITLGRQGRAVTATLTEASGVLVWGQDFEPGRGYIRAFRGPAFKQALENRTLELELEVWLRSRAWSDEDWVWAEFSTKHVPGMTRKQVRTALEKLKKNQVLRPQKHPKKQVTMNVTIDDQIGHNPKSDKTCVRFLTTAICESGEDGCLDTKGQARGKKGPAKGPVNKKGPITRDCSNKENEPPATRATSFSNMSGVVEGLDPDQEDIEDIKQVRSEPRPTTEPETQTRFQIRARADSTKIAKALYLQPETRFALQCFLEMLFTRNQTLDTRFILQDLRGIVNPETEPRIREWLMSRVQTGNRTWDIAELGVLLTRDDCPWPLDLDPDVRTLAQDLRPFLDPDNRRCWSRVPRPVGVSLEQRLEELAEHMARQKDVPDRAMVCSLYHYARARGFDRVATWVWPDYSTTLALDRNWEKALALYRTEDLAA